MCPWSVGPELSILKLNTTDFEIKRPRGFGDLLVPDRTLPQFAVKEADFFFFYKQRVCLSWNISTLLHPLLEISSKLYVLPYQIRFKNTDRIQGRLICWCFEKLKCWILFNFIFPKFDANLRDHSVMTSVIPFHKSWRR